MPTVHLQYEQAYRDSTSGVAAVRRYFVEGLSSADDILAAYAAGLPKIGDVLTIAGKTMTVSAVEAGQIIKPSERMFTVNFRTNFGYAGYRQVISTGPRYGNIRVELPNWTGSAGSGTWKPIVTPIKRGICQIVKTSYVSLSPSAVEFFLQTNQGKYYTINGIRVLLDGFKSLASESSALLIETYFKGLLPVRAYGVGSFPGQSIAIPALDHLGDYAISPPDPYTGADPQIVAKTFADLYDQGAAFPWTL